MSLYRSIGGSISDCSSADWTPGDSCRQRLHRRGPGWASAELHRGAGEQRAHDWRYQRALIGDIFEFFVFFEANHSEGRDNQKRCPSFAVSGATRSSESPRSAPALSLFL